MGIRERERQRHFPMEPSGCGKMAQGQRGSWSAGAMGLMEGSGAVYDAQAFLERYKRNISETFLVYSISQGYV